MDLKLTDKVALVTGSTAGIGFAIAEALATEGAHVCERAQTGASGCGGGGRPIGN